MFKKKDKQEDIPKPKRRNLKNTLKINDFCYIKVTENNVIKVDLVKNLFTNEYKEYITKLVPEIEIDQKQILKSLSGISEKLDIQVSNLELVTSELKTRYCINDLEVMKKSVDNIKETIREEILRDKKLSNYKDLIKSDFFGDVKTWKVFKDLDDVELAELLINLKKMYQFYNGGKI